MSGIQPIKLIGPMQRNHAIRMIQQADDGCVVRIDEETRSIEQNRKMWPMLTDLAKQIIWHGVRLTNAEWKDFATATLKSQKMIPNLDGDGFIAVGGKTSTMSKKLFADLIEIIYMIGARNEVVWSEKSITVFDEYGVEHQAMKVVA